VLGWTLSPYTTLFRSLYRAIIHAPRRIEGLGMRRRNLMTILAGAAAYTLLAGAAFVRPIAADAQPAAGIPRIGVLMGASPSDEAPKLEAFRGALEKLGYADGQTILIELRYAMGEPDRFG